MECLPLYLLPQFMLLFGQRHSHLAVDVYATSDSSPIPVLIFENHSQAYIVLITRCIEIKLYQSIKWFGPSTSPVLLFGEWSQVKVILFVETMD